MSILQDVNALIASMSLEEKVGQLFVFTWRNPREAESDIRFHPGGYIRIYSDALSVWRQSADIQARSRIPLIIAADLERGIGGTIGGALEVVTAMALGATRDTTAAFDAGRMIGLESAAMGINMNYAPVLDVNSNPLNPVINTRSFGADPQLVANLGIAFSKGLQSAGLATCGKHFPGHGDSGFDSHSSLGSVTATREHMEKVELVPFRAAINAGIDAIMSAHLLVPALESTRLPATLSKNVMTKLLRHELGFKGVTVTDALDMGAVANEFPPEVAIPMAVNAGCDQLIMPGDNAFAHDILLQAVKRGDISQNRLDEAVSRILTLKRDRIKPSEHTEISCRVSVPAHLDRALDIARSAVTFVKNNGIVPLKQSQMLFCLTFSNSVDGRGGFLEPPSFSDHLAADGWNVQRFNAWNSIGQNSDRLQKALTKARETDVIILAGYVNIQLNSGTIQVSDAALENLRPFTETGKPVILVSFGSPYLLRQFPNVNAYVCGYGATQPTQQAMAEALKGYIAFRGEMPVELH